MEAHLEKSSQFTSQSLVYLIIPYLVLHKNLTSFFYIVPAWKATSVKLPHSEISDRLTLASVSPSTSVLPPPPKMRIYIMIDLPS